MIPVTSFNKQKVAVFGLGGSGLATALALKAGGCDVVGWDDNPTSVQRAEKEGITAVDLKQVDMRECAALVLAPGVPLTHPMPHWSVDLAKGAGIPILGDVELFARERRLLAPESVFIAITGTNGKSTTTALISHVLRSAGCNVQMGGNIGRAVLTLDVPNNRHYFVVECSSYQIDLAPSLDPTIGVHLNLAPDHLDRHGTMERYASIKERLVSGSAFAVVGIDDPHSRAIADRLAEDGKRLKRISGKGSENRADIYHKDAALFDAAATGAAEQVAKLEGIPSLRGDHNGQNAAAAYAVCRQAGLSDSEIQAGFASFPGLAHRMEQVADQNGVLFINDSKATNADAAATALASFENIYWIAGGLAKEGGISALEPYFDRIRKVFLIGEAAPAFAAFLGGKVAFEISQTLDQAVVNAAQLAIDEANTRDDDHAVVLLSPACASFDQFANFEVRGEAFRQAVMRLGEHQTNGEAG